ncbi:23S rRNA (pseudouridine(1915)-N(3))-methyltransferase RlmH [Desulforhopalus singaporensis]|uniref:Ribosomal RNA large subunit methyltransferase H n=1 Tax=Desulforhopalus singaporensis TaxID=91360 RepID=A0A1H0PDR4_9BACT|nr:23S rRNA (pseudouridine(1915)-N(3))-methyltransferase RlmH [Desulforhopalus singaporensis]SDP03232.1 23S rRNA (pseudouridine1915-N3)-methyltransferase [Desulforhopalus singaporensis]
MKHEILLLGKTKDNYLRKGIDEFTGRLGHYTNFTISTLKEKNPGKSSNPVDAQGDVLLGAVQAGAMKIVLDSRGKQLSSEKFADQITRWEMNGVKHICYLIGGPEGHAQKVIDQADMLLSFSKMTFTHDMIRLLLVEQLYRAYTIKAGEKYHK